MTEISNTSESTFQLDVLEASSPVLVDFSAVWCQPCKMLEPIVEQLAGEWADQIKVIKVDVDDNPQLAMDYQVMGVPTLMLFKAGQPVELVSGYQPKDRLKSKFLPHLS